MQENTTSFTSIEIPSTAPVLLAIVAVHVLLGLTCVITGAVALPLEVTCKLC